MSRFREIGVPKTGHILAPLLPDAKACDVEHSNDGLGVCDLPTLDHSQNVRHRPGNHFYELVRLVVHGSACEFARQEEVDRAATELAVAEANVRTAREDRLTKKLEYERIKVQLERRTIRAPVAGVVTKLHKQVGEFVAPNNPDVLTLVQLDPLLANFTMMSEDRKSVV